MLVKNYRKGFEMTVKVNTLTHKTNAHLSPVKWLVSAWRVRDERLALAKLSDAELRDIGVSPKERLMECRRKFWDFS